MKLKINELEQLRKQCGLLSIERNDRGNLTLTNGPQSRKCGFYWIYTSYTLDELCKSTKSQLKGAVDIPSLANNRKGLNNVIKQCDEEIFWVVYNGIGGGSEDSKYGLGERILQEFRNNEKTGSLKILGSSLSDLSKWRYCYVELYFEEYNKDKKELETGWRLEYGWPILSKQ